MGLFTLVDREGFVFAFLVAGAGCALVAVLALVLRRTRHTALVLPVGGLVGTAVAVVAMDETNAVLGDSGALYRGLLALALAGLVTAPQRLPWLLRLLALIPGAVLIADAAQSAVVGSEADSSWVGPLAGGAVLLSATTFVDFDRRRAASGLGPMLLAITAGGVYLCVPDTEQALPVFGALLAVGFLGWPKPLASIGAAGACASVGLVVWTAAAGGRGHAASIIGATACLGILVLEPSIRALSRRLARGAPGPQTQRALALTGLHLVVVVLCSRLAGLRSSVAIAVAIVTVVYAGAAVLLWRRILPAEARPREGEPIGG